MVKKKSFFFKINLTFFFATRKNEKGEKKKEKKSKKILKSKKKVKII